MATKGNTFIDGVDLSEATSRIHLSDTGDVDDGNEAQVLKHSAYIIITMGTTNSLNY